MAILEIVKYPDKRLREPCANITKFDARLANLASDMAETMYAAPGIGLAAPQIGVNERLIVVDISKKGTELIVFVNPVIESMEETTESEEGCLSIPDYRDIILRQNRITVRAQDLHGNFFEKSAEGLFAICIQHEVDHLNGILFVDHLSRLKKDLFKKWAKKNLLED